jgi:uncharacterized protein CbrC (UPF0167 family)
MTNSDQPADQWRLDNARHLAGLTLHFRPYVRGSESWDHDHCAACGAKLTESTVPEIIHQGYATGPDYPKGAGYEWVCPTCFADLASALRWTTA